MTDINCVFCKMLNPNKINFLYENDNLFVLRDINPQAPVHLLIISKEHIRSVNDLSHKDINVIGDMMIVGKKMAEQEGVAQSGYKLFFNVEKGGGQVIFHLHLHLLGGWD